MSEHKPDPEFVEYLTSQVDNPHLSAATVLQMERVFIDQRDKYEARLTPARMANEMWEKTMMEVIGEDGIASVADAIRKLQDQAARAQQSQTEGVPEPFGTDSAYTIAKESGKGNMAISCELVVELVEALRAARAQQAGSGEVEPVSDPDDLLQCSDPDCARFYDEESKQMACAAVCGGRCAMDDTNPQPAQQGSVPEGWRLKHSHGIWEVVNPIGKPMSVPAELWGFFDLAFTTHTPQPEGDGWMQVTPYTEPGQIKVGDLLLISDHKTTYSARCQRICREKEDPEIVFNRKRNHYFITSMYLNEESWAKDVRIVRFKRPNPPAEGAE